MACYVYAIKAIDSRWTSLPTYEEYLLTSDGRSAIKKLASQVSEARREAAKIGWEGTDESDMHVFFLPSENEFVFGFAWKQVEDGTTFVVSPYELPWLDDLKEEPALSTKY